MSMADLARSIGSQFFAPKREDETTKTSANKKEEAEKSTALQLLDKETTATDMLAAFNSKMDNAGAAKEQNKLNQKLHKEMEKAVKELFDQDQSEDKHDTVKLSVNAIVNKSADLKKKADVEQKMQQSESESLDKDPARLEGKARVGVAAQQAEKQAEAQKKQQQAKATEQRMVSTEDSGRQETVKKYMAAFSEGLITNNPQKKKEAEQLRNQLHREGMPQKKVSDLEGRLRHVMSDDLRKKVKDGFIQYALSYAPSKPTSEYLQNAQRVKTLLNMVDASGMMPGASEELLENVRTEAKRDLRVFVTQELEADLAAKLASGATQEEIFEYFNKYNDLANLCMFNANDFLKNWMAKIDDLGLSYFSDPEDAGMLDTDASGGGRNQQPHQSARSDAESELIEDQLRLLFVQRSVKTDLRSQLDIAFKIRKLKNGMKRLGIYKEDLVQKLEQEAVGFAKLRFTEMIKEAFEERATLFELAGPAFQLVKNKLKIAIKGLKKMDAPIPDTEIRAIRDRANKAIFSISREEYMKMEISLESDPYNRFLISKSKKMLALLERLKAESTILDDIRPRLFGQEPLVTSSKVIEAA